MHLSDLGSFFGRLPAFHSRAVGLIVIDIENVYCDKTHGESVLYMMIM